MTVRWKTFLGYHFWVFKHPWSGGEETGGAMEAWL